MKRNLYFRTVLRRRNLITKFLIEIFLAFASYPRLLLEVFYRRHFGKRYFSMASVITMGALLLGWPLLEHYLYVQAIRSASLYFESDIPNFAQNYVTWYLFTAAFLYFSWFRYREVKLDDKLYGYSKFSLYSGDMNPVFKSILIFDKVPTEKLIATVIEPLLFFILGFLLKSAGQPIGMILIIASILYSLSYVADYKAGDDFVRDKCDELISNEEMANVFVHGMDGSKARGVRMYADKPADPGVREKLLPYFFEGNENSSEVVAEPAP